ncbi:hypothetical protein ABW19_dt0207188 [Dactylella cylindrospora]|nr:hypothetical protein ABW19_dt0207188 [Dactylella cylindrospora]
MSPRYPYPSRHTDSTGDSASLDSFAYDDYGHTSTTSLDQLENWWPSSFFNTRPDVSQRVSDFVKRSIAADATISGHEGGHGGGHGGDHSPSTPEDQTALIDAMEFSRMLGIYYSIGCLLFPVGIFVARKFTAKAKRWRKARNKRAKRRKEEVVVIGESSSNTSSESSSTSDFPIDGDGEATEDKPLLSEKSRWSTLLWRRTKGFLTYQPPNDARGRAMPSRGVIIFIFFWIALNYFLSAYGIYYPLDVRNNAGLRFFLLADRLGIIFTMNQPLNYLLAAKTSPMKHLTGWSYEQLNIFHQRLSATCLYMAIFHFAGMYGVYRIFIAASGMSFLQILSRPDILIGVISFCSFYFFNWVSRDEIRARAYEFFLITHIIFSAIAMGFLYFHHPTARIYVVTCFAIWFTDRLVYRLWRKRWEADAVVTVLDESTVEVRIRNIGGRGKQRAGKDKLVEWEWEPASHVFLTVPSWNRWQAHPFTIFTPPSGYDLYTSGYDDDGQGKDKDMVLVIRKLQGFSAALFDVGDDQGRVRVVLDGPYGSSHASEVLKESRKVVLIAGGSGIAVAWPLLIEVIRRQMDKAKKGKTGKGRKLVLLWIVQHEHHLKWIQEDLAQLEAVQPLLPRGTEVEIKKFVTKGPSGRRPDLCKEITEVAEDEDGIRRDGKTAVVVCGPDGMVRDVRTAGRDLLHKGRDMEIVAEKFGW